MVRPRHETIVITAEKQMKRLRENYSRRQLIQMFGAAGAASIAGCGGGGREETPTQTVTETPGQRATPTATEPEEDTPTEEPETPSPTATPGETVQTPTGEVTVTDLTLNDVTTQNFEQIEPNEWNTETGNNPAYQTLDLVYVPEMSTPRSTVEGAEEIILPTAAKTINLNTKDNILTIDLRKDLTWGDGSKFDAQNMLMHADILNGMLELGEQSETVMPTSTEVTDEYTLELQLLPGNPVIRMYEVLHSGDFARGPSDTHPKLHKKYVERIRSATTQGELQSAIKELFTARFSAEALPKMALGGFKATEWDPGKMIFEARTDFPWGLDFHPDQSRIFRGVRWRSVGEETNLVNAAVGGDKDWVRLPNQDAAKRFNKDKWTILSGSEFSNATINFSPKSAFGKKTETARSMRQAIAYLFDSEEFAAINNLQPAYEQTTGFSKKGGFRDWIGEDRFESWTNYGKGDTGYVFEEKGYRKLREAGFERNKNGVWIDSADGEPLDPEILLSGTSIRVWGMSRPVLNNVPEQLNRHGIKATGKFLRYGDEYENAVQNYDFDLATFTDQAAFSPHPYFGFREDVGLGSRDGLPAGVSSWDWRNGHRRVDVPMPVGNPDGKLTTYDFDKNVLEMPQLNTVEDLNDRVRELCWVLNQWVPSVYMIVVIRWSATNTSRINLTDGFKPKLWDERGHVRFNLPAGFWQPV